MEVSYSFTAQLKLDATSGNIFYPLIIPPQPIPSGYEEISRIIEFRYLRAKAHIRSVQPTPIINFDDFDSEAVRIQKAASLEWESERIQLNCYLSRKSSPIEYSLISSVSLLNNNPVPYRDYSLLSAIGGDSFLLDDQQWLYFQAQDVGYGSLSESENDEDWVSIISSGLITLYLKEITTPQNIVSLAPLTINPIELNLKGITITDGGGNDNDNNNNDNGDDEMGLIFKNADYQIVAGDRIVAESSPIPYTLTLPANPVYGTVVEILVLDDLESQVFVNLNGKSYKGESPTAVTQLGLQTITNSSGGKLIYSKNKGWVDYPGHTNLFDVIE